jgi:hypothetical protein
VVHNKLFARVTFQGMLAPRWFRLDYEDGTYAEYTTRVLLYLLKAPDDQAPPNLTVRPDPVTVLASSEQTVDWSILTATDLLRRMQLLMPGEHSLAEMEQVWRAMSPKKRRLAASPSVKGNYISLLTSVIDFRAFRVVMDPWAHNNVVAAGLEDTDLIIVVNDVLGKALSTHEPLEPHLYRKVRGAIGSLDAVVMVPPPLFADLAIVTAFHFVTDMVCAYVPAEWISNGHSARFAFLSHHEMAGTLITITDTQVRTHCWVCLFKSKAHKFTALRPSINVSIPWLLVDSTAA